MTEIAENRFSFLQFLTCLNKALTSYNQRIAMDPWQQKALAYGCHLPQHTAINLPDIHVHIAGKITRLKLHSLKKEIISK